jgi:hypothetical protein
VKPQNILTIQYFLAIFLSRRAKASSSQTEVEPLSSFNDMWSPLVRFSLKQLIVANVGSLVTNGVLKSASLRPYLLLVHLSVSKKIGGDYFRSKKISNIRLLS